MKTRLIYGATTNRVEEGKTEGEGNCRVSCGLEFCTKLEIGSKKVDSPCSNKRRVRNRRPSESKLTRVLFREYSQMELASRTGRVHPGSEGSLIFLFTNAMRGSVISMYREEKEIRTLSIDEWHDCLARKVNKSRQNDYRKRILPEESPWVWRGDGKSRGDGSKTVNRARPPANYRSRSLGNQRCGSMCGPCRCYPSLHRVSTVS